MRPYSGPSPIIPRGIPSTSGVDKAAQTTVQGALATTDPDIDTASHKPSLFCRCTHMFESTSAPLASRSLRTKRPACTSPALG